MGEIRVKWINKRTPLQLFAEGFWYLKDFSSDPPGN